MTAALAALVPAGPAWCDQYLPSTRIEDLIQPFQDGVQGFVGAMRDAGASVSIATTWRPAPRAYLMHWSCLVAGYRDDKKIFHQISAADVPPMAGVNIDWTCGGDFGAARSAAVAMVKRYDIVYPAALDSRHIERRAIDMTIHWQGSILVATRRGNRLPAAALTDLVPIGATWGVMKLASDPPHWSDDGR